MSGRGPRRQVLDSLATPLQRLKWLKGRWTVRATVYDRPAGAPPGSNMSPRARHDHEYPENTAGDWADLWRQTDAAIGELTALRAYAAQQHARLTAPGEHAPTTTATA